MTNLVLVTQAAQHSRYSPQHIRHLIRNGFIQGEKQGGIWLVDLDDLQRYEREMTDLGAKKFDPTRGQEQ
jgi:hypothetical protein